MVYKRVRGQISGGAGLYKKIFELPLPPAWNTIIFFIIIIFFGKVDIWENADIELFNPFTGYINFNISVNKAKYSGHT